MDTGLYFDKVNVTEISFQVYLAWNVVFALILDDSDFRVIFLMKNTDYTSVQSNNDNNNNKKITPINSNANYRREMKLVPTNMDYCLLQFYALKFFLGVRLHGGLYLTLVFSM